MRCEDFLPWFEGGGAQAEAARRHAEECASCRAAAEMLERVKAALAAGEPMPAAMRAAMLGVAEDGSPSDLRGAAPPAVADRSPVDRAGRRRLWFAAIAASLVAAAWGIWRYVRNDGDLAQPTNRAPGSRASLAERPKDVRRVGPITVVTVDSSRELAALDEQLAELQQTLAEAKSGAERLAVSQALDRVLLDFQRTVAVSDSP